MWLPFQRKKPDESDDRLERAQAKACELEERSEKVVGDLAARLRRNHWGQTVAEIARGER